MKTFRVYTPTIFAILFSFAFLACNNYFKAKTVSPTAYPNTLEKAKKEQRLFIMQSGINFYTITSVDTDQAKQQMTVTLNKIDSARLIYVKNPGLIRKSTKAGEATVKPEIHVYMKDSTSYTLDEPHTIPLSQVARIDLWD